LIRSIGAFIDAAAALVAFGTTALKISPRCSLAIRAARTIGLSLLHDASVAHAGYAMPAQPMHL
jgi:hypothetical protein